MGSSLPRGPPCCSRLPKATSQQSAFQTVALCPHGRARVPSNQPRRVIINAFLFNPLLKGSSSNGSSGGASRSRETIASRLSELRSPPDDDDRAAFSQRPSRESEDDSNAEDEPSGTGASHEEAGAGLRVRIQMGPWPAETSDDGDGADPAQGGGVVTPRSIRYMVADPRPEIKLLHRFKPGQGAPDNSDFWRSFMHKCRLAWGVFFPPEPHARRRYPSSPLSKLADGLGQLLTPGAHGGGGVGAGGGDGEGSSTVTGLSAKEVVLNRLQMVLIADRCGVSPEDLLEMKAQTLTALAEYMGKDLEEDVEQLEVQVSALKPNGEKVTMTIGFAAMLADEQLRDPIQYHYEFEDDDDYFFPEEDDGRVADIAEPPSSAPKAIWGGVAAQQKQQQQLQRQHAASRGGAAAAAGAGAGAGEGGTCY